MADQTIMEKSRIKILCAINKGTNGCIPLENFANIQGDGIEKHVMSLSQSQRDLELFINQNFPKSNLIPHGTENNDPFLWPGKNLMRCLKYVRKIKPDVLHAHHTQSVLIGVICRIVLRSTFFFITAHNNYNYLSRLQKFIWAMGLFVSNAVVCNSLNTLKSLPRFVHKKKLFLIYNGVDFNKTHRSNVPKDSNQFVVGTACRFVEQKDLETLLRGFHKFISKNEESDAILLLIGDGPKMPNLVDLSVRLKIQEKIIFKGEMSRSEVYKELQQLDVFVVSSIYEGFCNAMVEAAGTGLAIVATDIEPLPEVIGRENACFFRVGDSQALANIIDELQENPHHRAELGRLAEKYVISRYSLEKSSQKYFELYKDFLNEQS